MKRFIIVLILSLAVSSACFAQSGSASAQASPPLLLQQNVPPAPAAAVPGLTPPQAPLNVAAPQAPPAPPAGIPLIQTIPVETLLNGLPAAAATAQKLAGQLQAGKVWLMRAPAGELEIKAGLLYQGVVVALLRVNPADGSLLPLGVNPHAYQSSVPLGDIKARLSGIIKQLHILPAAEFMEPEACWSFPLVYGNTIVTHVKVYYDGMHVLQDYMANQEMAFYGQ